MAGILGYLAALADDVSSLAGKTMVGATNSITTSLNNSSVMLDDIATYTKVASVKSSGIVIDDLAAISTLTNKITSNILEQELQKVSSMDELKANINTMSEEKKRTIEAELESLREYAINEAKRKATARELPIVWKIAKGSFVNKLIIIPLILLINTLVPWMMPFVLIAGGLFLVYEGTHSVLDKLFSKDDEASDKETIGELSTEKFETEKVKSAVQTDFILSLEIMVLALSSFAHLDIIPKIGTLFLVGIITTVAVYGIVALIIKLDDIGFYLQARERGFLNKIGDGFVAVVPYIIGFISIIGTVAMLAVGGEIILHQAHLFHDIMADFRAIIPAIGGLLEYLFAIVFGLIVGSVVMLVMMGVEKIKPSAN
ncbi:MAG: DUF808 family protein [Epsilonproteobacteria bacterium]|nr:DUF808 family protein [Campylobacterota bacterium]MBD3839380.1 DUF808 family protein [Campylobacterota bacterium]